ncbi:MAG: DUF6158 family protein [Actinomycetota bacterium]|nr:DUF6158 family protein [Actinomycetota bacterium]
MQGVPAHDLTDEELERQGLHAHATRHWVFLHGTAEQFRTHTNRMLELEQEYLRRHPQRTWQGVGGGPEAVEPVTSRIRDLVHTFVQEIDYLLGDADEPASGPGPAEATLLARIAGGPGGRMHKLAVHQLARELGAHPRAVAQLYKSDPPLLAAAGEDRALTDAGQAWLAAAHP